MNDYHQLNDQGFNQTLATKNSATNTFFHPSRQIVFIDSQVEDYQHLAAGVLPGTEVIILDLQIDGIEKITEILEKFTNISNVHIIAHGSPGSLQLGSSYLSLDTLAQYTSQLQTWCKPNTLLLYGCNVAAGDAGAEFIAKLHQLTGTEIAASAKRTGNSNLGGDWNLEVKTGNWSVPVAFTTPAMTTYPFILAMKVDNLDAIYLTATPDKEANYAIEGAVNRAGVVYNHNFGIGEDNNLVISSFTVAGEEYIITDSFSEVNLNRVDNATVTGNRELLWFELDTQKGSDLNFQPSAATTMEEVLSDIIINRGTDNIFTNQGNGDGNNNNIERVDFLVTSGLSPAVEELDSNGFLLLERSGNDEFQNDNIQIAPITAIDAQGNPTKFGALIEVSDDDWNPSSFVVDALITRQDEGDSNLRYTSSRPQQSISSVFFTYAELGITDEQTFYGYALFPPDINEENDLVGLSDFPGDTSEFDTGLDLIASGIAVLDDDGNDNTILATDDDKPVTLTHGDNHIFTLTGPTGEDIFLNFTLTQAAAFFVNELGFYKVDDGQGTVNGVAPDDPEYLETVLNSGSIIFSALSETPQLFEESPTRIVDGFQDGDQFGFYMVVNSTVEQILADLDLGLSTGNVFFSPTNANVDNFDHAQVFQTGDNTYTVNWEDLLEGGDLDFNDLIFELHPTLTEPPLGNKLQGLPQHEVVDLTEVTGQVTVNVEEFSNAELDNVAGFYPISDIDGTVVDPVTGVAFAPGDAGYAEAALQGSVAEFVSATESVFLEGGAIYAPYLQVEDGSSFFAFVEANADSIDHVRLLADNTFGFEDMTGGGDLDYDDVVFSVDVSLI